MTVNSFYEDEHAAFRDSVANFLEHSVSVAEQRRSGSVSPEDMTLAAEQGLTGINVPESCGGGGVADLRFPMVIIEEAMRRGAIGYALTMTLQSFVVVPALIAVEDLAEGAEILSRIAEGRTVVAVAGTHLPLSVEGSDENEIVVNGTARSVIAGVIATDVLVVCRTENGERIVALVDASDGGVHRTPKPKLLGGNDAGTVDVVFEAVRVAPERVLRSPGAAARLASDFELLLAAVAVGGAAAAYAWTSEYASDRKVFGSPLNTFENTRYVLAGLAAQLVMARSALRHALTERTAGVLPNITAAALAVTATGLYSKSVDEGLQLHGGYGYMHEYPIAQAFADAEFLRLLVDHLDVALGCDEAMMLSL